MDELQQNLQQHFSRTAQVSFGGFPIYPNPCIIEDLEALLRGGVLGVSGGLRDWRTVTVGLDAEPVLCQACFDVCHWLCQCFLRWGALAKPVARNASINA